MSLEKLKRELAQAKNERNRYQRAVERLSKLKAWARKAKLGYVARRLDSAIDHSREKKETRTEQIGRLKERIRNWQPDVPPEVGGWHPGATRTQVQAGIGGYLNVPAKLVWHTTEGSSLPVYSGSHPHFTLHPQTGQLWQHISIDSGAMALRNLSGGVETNRANCVQVELIGFAAQTHNWSDAAYANLAKLARWIEQHHGVARKCSVTFTSSVHHVSNDTWLGYSGHIGHQHVPENDHWDPGQLKIEKVL
jgi:hypothetical protein